MFIDSRMAATSSPLHEREPRRASKIKLRLPSGLIVFVAGKRGKLNFVGGGIKDGESTFDALHRETSQEIGVQPEYLHNVREVGALSDEVTDSRGNTFIAEWILHEGDLILPPEQKLFIPSGSEITEIVPMSEQQGLGSDRVLGLAKRALRGDYVSVR